MPPISGRLGGCQLFPGCMGSVKKSWLSAPWHWCQSPVTRGERASLLS